MGRRICWRAIADGPADMRRRLGSLARLLREDMLPKSGRDFLAEKLETIAAGGNPLAAAGRAQQQASAAVVIALASNGRSANLGVDAPTSIIYERVGRPLGLEVGHSPKGGVARAGTWAREA